MTRRGIWNHVAAAVFTAMIVAPSAASAQDYGRIAPKVPPPNPAPVVALPAPPAPAAPLTALAPTAVLLPELKGVVFVASTGAVDADTALGPEAVDASGIAIQGLALLNDSAFQASIRPFIGRPLTVADLDRLITLTRDWYRERGKPFVAVIAPPQNVGGGVLRVVVMQYHVSAVRVAGAKHFSDELLISESGLKEGNGPSPPLDLRGLNEGLEALNANPFRSVDVVFSPGDQPGETTAELKVKDQEPWRVYAGFDNQGQPSLGRYQWSGGGVYANLFGLDQQISGQVVGATTGRYVAYSMNYTAPLPWNWRDKLMIFGSYASETPDVGPDLNSRGHTGQVSVRYDKALPSLAFGSGVNVTADLQLGYDYKISDNNLEFGGVSVFATTLAISQFPLILFVTEKDRYGQTLVNTQFVYSPGHMLASNTNTAFRDAVSGSNAQYEYGHIDVTRTTLLPHGFSAITKLSAQAASTNLMYSEQFGLGGLGSVRGYAQSSAIGSNGVFASQEVRGPTFSLAKDVDASQVGVFLDYGRVSQVVSIPDVANGHTLMSLGALIETAITSHVKLLVDVAGQLRTAPNVSRREVGMDIVLTTNF